MDQDSLLKRTLVLTGTIAGLSALFIALVSVVLVVVTDRAVAGWQGSRAPSTAATSAPSREGSTDAPAAPRGMFNPATPLAGPKPNG
jgi:hypothetical protein